ncbi:amidohydrolase [Megasphaera vaginalis (ex Srinivasan et al. 2021)]|uniref:Peptidase M20 domain-containing protein 2 n=1 Tax=Megasphaera vaginalis (ex Srinivasan et al. 2021) TaxID=1111454 RepID=U7UB11_9FIRM|nr:amidohydrolase [Megasphaera vaginalis (ex Srinivasan et al. 2021)]ERT56506.1 amidohydrolase [Megasphaera vaginalis (ex Srinivasan et al. 2021)]
MNKKERKDAACRRVDELEDLIRGIAVYIHEHPELGGQEELAAAYLRKILTTAGFAVDNPIADVFPTAFHAVYGNGAKQIAFLAEYDALPEIGHGCGHNLIAAMSVGAALAFAAVAAEEATVHVFGCPAEETAGSKVYMSERGLFDEMDAALLIHPATDRTAIGGTSYATHPLQFTFTGKAAHIADKTYHGVNALDALVDFYGALQALSAQFTEEHLLGAIITDGGTAPNIVPDKAVMKATIRALQAAYLEETMLPQIRDLAEETAARHGASVEMVHYEPLYKEMRSDPRLDVYFAEAFSELYEEFTVLDDDFAEGATDVGNVSQATRASQPEICIGYHIGAHAPEFAAAAISDLGLMQAVTGAKAMARVAVDVMLEKAENPCFNDVT